VICWYSATRNAAYATLESETVPAAGLALSWQGRVFRYESRNLSTLERLWEFSVRELVCVADPDRLPRWRDDVVDLICEMATDFDLDLTIRPATDPFFATVAAAKRFWQQSMASKYEVRLTVGQDHDGAPVSVAAGSVNLHGTFFAERFDLRTDAGHRAGTACAGEESSPVTVPEWNSLKHIELIVEIEMAYRVRFSRPEIASLRTVGEIRSLLSRKGAGEPPADG
jgi:hypothetical protein